LSVVSYFLVSSQQSLKYCRLICNFIPPRRDKPTLQRLIAKALEGLSPTFIFSAL